MNATIREHGHTLVEMLVVVALIAVAASVAIPHIKAYAVESHLLGAGRVFKGRFREARSMATRSNAYTAIRFEERAGRWQYSLYRDGDLDGVTAADIAAGRDPLIGGPYPLDAGAPGVRVGINPGVPAPPPDTGMLDPYGDPIRFGRGDMLSFSPLGTATPGTFYLAGQHGQAAVRVTGGSARVRLMVCRGTRWLERP
jgi:prepilin-type N-terminal cleavage/methylation domain-containing protein